MLIFITYIQFKESVLGLMNRALPEAAYSAADYCTSTLQSGTEAPILGIEAAPFHSADR